MKDAGRTYNNIVKVNKSVADAKVFSERNKFFIQFGASTCIRVFTSTKWRL
jgi:hypothetical protein